jgi:hypothetical protein
MDAITQAKERLAAGLPIEFQVRADIQRQCCQHLTTRQGHVFAHFP